MYRIGSGLFVAGFRSKFSKGSRHIKLGNKLTRRSITWRIFIIIYYESEAATSDVLWKNFRKIHMKTSKLKSLFYKNAVRVFYLKSASSTAVTLQIFQNF